jgi:CBS domain-containing protein
MSDRNSSDVQQLGLLEGGFVDRTPPKVSVEANVRQALDLMMTSRVWGLPVLEHGQDYVGMITAASLFSRCMPIHPETLLPHSGLAWLPDPVRMMRARLGAALENRVEDLIDVNVPPVRVSTSPADAALLLIRRTPVLPVIADSGRRFIGTLSWSSVIGGLHETGLP